MTKKHVTLFFILFLVILKSTGQCVITCNQNVGVFSNNDPSTIGYDNMTSSFHSSIASEELGFRVWGENMLNNGTSHALSPIYINSTNYPALTGTVYFAGVGSSSQSNVQLIVLTSTGLFASGVLGAVISTSIKNTTSFSKITVNGKTDGLPFGITPDSVKMMFVSSQTIILTTCGGNVYVLSQGTNIRGDIGNAIQWSQVKMTNGQPLTGIIATRGNSRFTIALKNDNTLWTWGDSIRLGNGSLPFSSNNAVQMILPTSISKIKMIQGTSLSGSSHSYYLLDTTNKVFALGENSNGQLADNTTIDKNVWINCLYSNGTLINDAKWISSNEHDLSFPNIGIINVNSQMRTAGMNSSFMIGRTINTGANFLDFPSGITATDTIMFCEVGGHTSAFIKKNTPRYGYVGHHVNGSIGNNSSVNSLISSVNFFIPPIISICGTVCDTPIISKKPFNCNDSIATFVIKGRRNNIVRFNINGTNDSVIIGNNDTAIISRIKPNGDLALNITQVNSVYCNLSLAIKDTLKLSTIKDSILIICKNKPVIFNQNIINTSGIYKDTLSNIYGCDSIVTLYLTVIDTSKKDSFLTICQPTTIFFNNQTVSFSGVYLDTLINSKGCDSILTLNLTVNPKTFGSFSQTICEGSSFFFNSINQTVSGTYFDTLVNTKGCDSILTLNLTVNPKTFGTINQTICQGSSFIFNGINRTVSGTYLDTLINAKGCDSILTLNLTVNPKTFGIINQTICQGNSFLFNGNNRTISGTYLDTLINAKGCDSILTLNLTVNPKTFGTINQSICQGNSFLFNGTNRTISGTYLDTIINAKSCDSILTLNLTVNPITFGTINRAICEGSSFFFNSINRTVSGIYLDTLVNAKGCDSILTLNLIVNSKTFGSFSQTICEGSSFIFNGINRTVSGTYLDTLVNAKGCDSILTLNLMVNPITFGTINQTICQGNSFLFNGINQTISGTYLDTLINSKGCDSILTLNLTVNPKTFGSFSQTICEGSSFLFNGISRTISSAYLDTLVNAKGCDSILTLNLTVNPITFGTINQSICQGSSFLFNGMNRTVSGTYLDTLINSKGCDSILTLNLTVNPKTFGSFSQTICEGSSFIFNGINRTVSGTYMDTLVNAKGCDSILTLNLTVNPKTFGSFSQTICEGSSFLFNGISRTISSAYLDTLVNAKGCDSILTLNLTVNPITFGTINQSICQGSSFLFNGMNRTVSGTYLDTLINSKGCDSILTLNLTVNPKTSSTINNTICEGSSFLFNGISRTISGAYLDTLVNAKGCDSILTLNLTVNPITFGTINQSICQGNSFLFNGINRIVSGIYLDTLVNAKGCDSILTLNLNVNPKTSSTINNTICEGSSFLGRTNSGTYIDTLLGANAKGCDSIRTLFLIVNPKTFGTINQSICQGNSFLFNGTNRTISGTYLDTLINAKGCDSILTLNLTVNPKTFGIINQTICQGNSFLFNGNNRTISGTYLDTLINAKGCDSILTLNLTVNPKTFGTINQSICQGSSFLFNGFNRTVTGSYLDTLINSKGCDSILTLNLTVNPKTFGSFSQTICEGSSFLFNGISRTISGAYLDTLVNAKGCDSILTLNLTVNPITFGTINQTICQGQFFLGRTSSGTYIDTLSGVNANGCDSIRTLILIVNKSTYSNFNQTICEGESFFNRSISGSYSDTFININGCDSVRNLILIVNPVSKTKINQTICQGNLFLGKSITGIYLDTFKNLYGCDSIREVNLTVIAPILKTLNYSICEGESFRGRTKTSSFIDTIKNGLGCDSIIETVDLYVRPNIDSSFKIRICEGRSYRGKTVAGNYIDSFTNEYGCISKYRYQLSLKVRSFNNETKTICNDQKYKGYTKSGIYSDTFINQFGCDSIITLNLFVKSNFITQKLQDTTIQKGDSVQIQAQKGFLYYTWNTKATTSKIIVFDEGKYIVTIMNQDGCIAYDSCNVFLIPRDTSGTDTTAIDSVDGYAECPNIFTPNDDYKNDLFKPNFYGNIDVVRFIVFTRFGEKIYEGHGNFSAWDGIYKGEKCEPGVYVYFIEYINKKGKHLRKGSVTLMR